jgi:hypothetical protein
LIKHRLRIKVNPPYTLLLKCVKGSVERRRSPDVQKEEEVEEEEEE